MRCVLNTSASKLRIWRFSLFLVIFKQSEADKFVSISRFLSLCASQKVQCEFIVAIIYLISINSNIVTNKPDLIYSLNYLIHLLHTIGHQLSYSVIGFFHLLKTSCSVFYPRSIHSHPNTNLIIVQNIFVSKKKRVEIICLFCLRCWVHVD